MEIKYLNREKHSEALRDLELQGLDFAVVRENVEPCSTTKCQYCQFRSPSLCAKRKEDWLKSSESIEVRWKDLAIDTPIWVRKKNSDQWQRAHFAGVVKRSFSNKDRILAFKDGKTSWTSDLRYGTSKDIEKYSEIDVSFESEIEERMEQTLIATDNGSWWRFSATPIRKLISIPKCFFKAIVNNIDKKED